MKAGSVCVAVDEVFPFSRYDGWSLLCLSIIIPLSKSALFVFLKWSSVKLLSSKILLIFCNCKSDPLWCVDFSVYYWLPWHYYQIELLHCLIDDWVFVKSRFVVGNEVTWAKSSVNWKKIQKYKSFLNTSIIFPWNKVDCPRILKKKIQ